MSENAFFFSSTSKSSEIFQSHNFTRGLSILLWINEYLCSANSFISDFVFLKHIPYVTPGPKPDYIVCWNKRDNI